MKTTKKTTKTKKATAKATAIPTFDFDRDFRVPVEAAIVKFMASRGSVPTPTLTGTRYRGSNGEFIGCLSVPMCLTAPGAEDMLAVNCHLHLVFSSDLDNIVIQMREFAAVNYQTAKRLIEEETRREIEKGKGASNG